MGDAGVGGVAATDEALSDLKGVGSLLAKGREERSWLIYPCGTHCGGRAHWRCATGRVAVGLLGWRG